MESSHVIVTLNIVRLGKKHDIEIPLDISASELCSAIYQKFLPEYYGDVRQYYLKSERPTALLRGERTLREYGIRDGSVIIISK
ncbi:MAG: EsaB/YukD family protein [Oscillospiraceae bacterium]|nr:EsaB/YukD family protein [Oscillospiraceae bacterium]